MAELQVSETLETTMKFKKVQVKELLGEGGQGWVYLVDYDGRQEIICSLLRPASSFWGAVRNYIRGRIP